MKKMEFFFPASRTSKCIALILFLSCPMLLLAHDVITKNDKTEIKAKGVKILSDVIKYSEWDNQNGPLYNIPKSQVFMTTYQNGKKNSYKIGNYCQ